MNETHQRTDVAIVGGGMAGASLALMLSHFCPQLRVVLLEQRALPDVAASVRLPSFDTRATAIAAGSLQLFRQLDLWPALREYSAPIQRIQVSDRSQVFGACLTVGEQQWAGFEGMLGAVIENAALGPILHSALADTPVKLVAPAQVTTVCMGAPGASLRWRAGEGCAEHRLTAGLLVIAEGADSPLCRQLGIEIDTVKYQQRALVTTVGLQRDHSGVAHERFTADGPMALLPLPQRDGLYRAALVWVCGQQDAEALCALSERQRLQQAQRAFGWRAGRFVRMGSLQAYPLSLSLAREQWRRNIVLIGNCAHFLHPVAGQGFNLTLRDCYGLAQAMAGEWPVQGSSSQLQRLAAYGRGRRLDQQLTVGFSDRIPVLFAASNPLLQGLRQMGMLGLTLVPPLRSAFVRQAAGFGL
ncbi:FAD-dependent monooxygenase [Microbulbifer sp. 2205BS26-8]|uniref:FAD-dependent monooxygenase n=1 Tax=Microbulbifer sp. 2205BS26-8 TaxID=3064386 RepID=UPI00273FBD80|nr:FAD-dependent monooxygenase [Microbulbifer sp. 2205BS26-8]MDP5210452.1 FAD-dependent monooxygenase [Microbulbifer sp. 2205BS26-8]